MFTVNTDLQDRLVNGQLGAIILAEIPPIVKLKIILNLVITMLD